mgnify:CR=1 FL=1
MKIVEINKVNQLFDAPHLLSKLFAHSTYAEKLREIIKLAGKTEVCMIQLQVYTLLKLELYDPLKLLQPQCTRMVVETTAPLLNGRSAS